LAQAGHCDNNACVWFSQPTSIPGEPTLNDPRFRTYNIDVTGGSGDWSRKMPWRSPGAAPVLGSGCGVAGGGPVPLPNGGTAPPSVPQGFDGFHLPKKSPAIWHVGAIEEVAWAITANHGGGYSYRLCKLGENVSEACFQRTPLRFAGDKQWLQYGNTTYQYSKEVKLSRFELPLVKVTKGTFPSGSEWARVPVPGCRLCDQSVCGPGLMPNETEKFKPGGIFGNATFYGGLKWFRQQQCAQSCAGLNLTACPPGMTQFPEPLSGISGYTGTYPPVGHNGLEYSIVDNVIVPQDIEEGDCLLSWRWDCEQSHQIWQNCADIRIVNGNAMPRHAVLV
jgi:hypothetical protein